MDNYLSKEDTKVVKGIAIVLMLMFHLWGFPDRIAGELKHILNIFGISSLVYLGHFGNICVSIFFFGGVWHIYNCKKDRIFVNRKNKKPLYTVLESLFYIYSNRIFIFFKPACLLS